MWSQIGSDERLCRSSHAVSVVQRKLHVFGGELKPREPVGNHVDILELGGEAGKLESINPALVDVCR